MLCQRGMSSSCVCLSVCPSVCPSQVEVLQRRLNWRWRKQRRMVARALYFSEAKDFGEIPTGSSWTGAPNRGGVGSDWRFSINRPISLYLKNGASRGGSYHGTLIGTAIYWMELFSVTFGWPQTTLFPSQASTVRKRLHRSSSFLAPRLPSTYPTLCWKWMVSP